MTPTPFEYLLAAHAADPARFWAELPGFAWVVLFQLAMGLVLAGVSLVRWAVRVAREQPSDKIG
jgi:hypothetical protein